MADQPNILVIWGDDIGITNLSCYSDGLMGYRTPNIDRIADEGMRFTDSYGEQSCTAGRASFITGQSVFRTGLSKVGVPGADVGLQAEDVTIAELLKPLGLRDRPVRQEPPRRPQQVPADGPRLRRVLRQPLPPQRGGGAGDAELAAEGGLPALRRAVPPARRHPLMGDRRGRRHPARALRARRAPADRGHGPADEKRMETIDDEVLDVALGWIDRQAAADTPFFCWFNTTHMHFRTHTKPESLGQAGRWQSPYHDTMIDHDKVVGALLDKLDELGLAEDTIVVYSTDNGPHMNTWPDGGMTPFRSEKNTNWEGAFRVPR
jgi:arylsulfatase